MDKIKVILVDDEASCLESLSSVLSSYDDIEIIGSFDNGNDASSFLEKNHADGVFMDIEMDQVNGFALADYIRKRFPDIAVVFQTGHAGYALEGYEYDPADFLVKPVTAINIERAVRHMKERLNRNSDSAVDLDEKIGISTGKGFSIVTVKDILFAEKSGRKVLDERIETNYSLKELHTILSPYDFIFTHQSYLVPVWRIKKVQNDPLNRRTYIIYIDGYDEPLPLSRDRYEELSSVLNEKGIAIH